MKIVFNLIALIFGILLSIETMASDLTLPQINSVLERVDQAINSHDADALAKELSNEVKITMQFDIPGQKQVMQPSKSEYVDMLKQGWAQYSNYKYAKSNVKIELNGAKAFVSDDVTESMDIQGQHLSAHSREEVIIEIINDQPLITSIVGHTDL